MSTYVLDASALLALVRNEPGADRVHSMLADASISTVNLAEVGSKLADLGFDPEDISDEAHDLGLSIEPFDQGQGRAYAALRHGTRSAGLSLGDRACLALARQLGATAMTTDRAWAELDLDVQIELIR